LLTGKAAKTSCKRISSLVGAMLALFMVFLVDLIQCDGFVKTHGRCANFIAVVSIFKEKKERRARVPVLKVVNFELF
jgi:hypothetical protein